MLQDNVPAFEASEAVAIIERNLGGRLLEKFDTFDMVPIAAASLGQVSYHHCWDAASLIDDITIRPLLRSICGQNVTDEQQHNANGAHMIALSAGCFLEHLTAV